MFGMGVGEFWMLIGAPVLVIALMFIKCLTIRKEPDD